MSTKIFDYPEYSALKSALRDFSESIESDVIGETPGFQRPRELAYKLTSAMNEFAWEVWDRPFLPEHGLPDFEGPYGYAEPCIFVTFVQKELDAEGADAALEGVRDLLEKEGLYLAKVVYSAGDAELYEPSVEISEIEDRPLRLKIRRILTQLRFPWAG